MAYDTIYLLTRRRELPAEAEKNGEHWEKHDWSVANVRQVDSDKGDVHLYGDVVDEDEEEDETDEGGDKDEETKEETCGSEQLLQKALREQTQ